MTDPRGPAAPLAGVHVLVVDDDPDSRRILRAVLEYGGAVVSVAATARDALGILERVRADVILTDVALPGEDGYRLVQHVRGWPAERGRIPVVAMTAAHDERDEILHAGFSEHLRTPIAIEGLYRTIGSVSGRGGRR
jgi:CheY-like chemotaxis protein